jgi:uncharacterized repeat protein (TIGR01451 family)
LKYIYLIILEGKDMRRLLHLSILPVMFLAMIIVMLDIPVYAYVNTDIPEYSPGSIVTISGDNSDRAGYLPGETIKVFVSGPNGYISSFYATAAADSNAAWSGQVTLWYSDFAVGSYTYTATGITSGVTQTGIFTDRKIDTTLTVNSASGYYGGTTALSATLTETLSGNPLIGETVIFKLADTVTVSAVTNGSGVASLSAATLDSISSGTYNNGVHAQYIGSPTYNNAEAHADLTITAGAGSITINDVALNEGNSGTTNFTFTVAFTRTSNGTVNVNWTTADGTALASSDYVAASGTLSWTDATSGNQTITIVVNGDAVVETSETFFINLSGGTGGPVFNWTDAQGQGMIINDDLATKANPVLLINNSPQIYNSSPQAATVVGSVSGTVSNIKYNNFSTIPINAGTYAITADFAPTDNINYNNLTGASAGYFIINPAAPTVTVSGGPFCFDTLLHAANVAVTGLGGITVSGSAIVTYSPPGNTTVPINPGTYAVSVAFTSTNTNYSNASGSGTLVIQQPTIEVSKKASSAFACPGDTVIFTILVLNKSCVDLNLVSFQDTVLGDISSHFPEVLPAERMQTWSYSYTLQSSDPQPFANFATANYRSNGSSAVVADIGSVTLKCGAVVGGEVVQDDFLRMVIPFFSLAAFVVGGGVIVALKRKYYR